MNIEITMGILGAAMVTAGIVIACVGC